MCLIAQPLSCEQCRLAHMTKMFSSLRRMTRLSAIVPLAAIVLYASTASAKSPLGSAQKFAVLAGTAVTCTDAVVTGDVGVWPGSAVTRTRCTVLGTVHQADGVAKQAYMDFINAYNSLLFTPPPCNVPVTATLTETLVPGVYCVDATAKTGPLMLDAVGDANAVWIFLVDGALTGNSFNVVMINGGQPGNVYWRTGPGADATLTDSNFLGTILSGAAITVTRGTFTGHALATAGVTLTGVNPVPRLAIFASSSGSSGSFPPVLDKCEANHDKDGDDHDKGKDHKDKDNDKDHKDSDRKDKDHESKDKKK